jgi:phytoene synthase
VVDESYAVCLRIARLHYENFPVASGLLPRATRPHVAAVYAFARTADDFADEGTRDNDTRLALLDDWRRKLNDAVAGRVKADGSEAGHIFTALSDTIRQCDLEPRWLEDLLSAFRQDVLIKRYETWEALLDYCRRSANPVGRLVLRLAGYRSDKLDESSDALCTALQLTNFWQDLEVDWRRGRLYVPATFTREAGADEADLDRGRWSSAWRAALERAGRETRQLFARGRPVADDVRGRLGWELRATWHGGMRILERTERAGFNVFGARPALGPSDALVIAWRTVTWRRGVADEEIVRQAGRA